MKNNYFIGLGGSGGKIITQLYNRLMSERGESFGKDVACIAIDTDQTDLKALAELGVETVCLSGRGNVGEIFNVSGGDVGDWFPNTKEETVFYSDKLYNGASQSRIKSRLLLSCLLKDAKNELHKILEDSLTVSATDSAYVQQEPVVFIASSLAGGTGSGTFIQTALYIKKFFREQGIQQVSVYGLFALPDLYVGVVDRVQPRNLYSNAYAAIRELNAFNLICGPDTTAAYGGKIELDMEISTECEGKLFEKDSKGRYAHKPYDNMYFIDKVNCMSTIRGGLDEYYKAMADIAYTHLYTPIKGSIQSTESNLTKNHIIAPTAIYGSAGATTAKYPFDDILEYFAARAINESIVDPEADEDDAGTVWRFLDNKWNNYCLTKTASARARGLTEYIPDPRERANTYIDDFNSAINTGSLAQNKFSFLAPMVETKDDKGVSASIIDAYVEKVRDTASATIQVDAIIKNHRKTGGLDNLTQTEAKVLSELKNYRESLGDSKEDKDAGMQQVFIKIKEIDDGLERFCKDSLQRISDISIDFANRIFCVDADMASAYDKDEIGLVNGLLYNQKTKEWVHPVAARYLLYSLRKSVEEESDSILNSINDTVKDDVDDFRDFMIRSIVIKQKETLNPNSQTKLSNLEILQKSLDKAVVGKKRAKGGVTEYFKQLRKNVNKLNATLTDALLLFSYQQLSERINALIAEYETFFDNILDFSARAKQFTDSSAAKHDNSVGTVYVCASEETKKLMYADVKQYINTQTGEVASQISRSLFTTMRTKAIAGAKAKGKKKVDLKQNLKTIDAILDSMVSIVSESFVYNPQIQALNKNIFEAMLYEYQLTNPENADDIKNMSSDAGAKKRVVDHITDTLNSLAVVAAPALLYDNLDMYHGLFNTSDEAGNIETRKKVSSNFRFISHSPGVAKSIAAFCGGTTTASDFYTACAASMPKDPDKFNISLNYVPGDSIADNTIVFYSVVNCLQPYQIAKFNELKNGVYFTNYADIVDEMEHSGNYSLTPHLDKRWHKHGAMPYINVSKEIDRRNELAKAFIFALAYKKIGYTKDGVISKFVFQDPNMKPKREPEVIVYQGRSIPYNRMNRVMRWFENQDSLISLYAAKLDMAIEQDLEKLSRNDDTVASYNTAITMQSSLLHCIRDNILSLIPINGTKTGKDKKKQEKEDAIGILRLAWEVHVTEENDFDKDYGELLVDALCDIIHRYAKAPYNADKIANKEEGSEAYENYIHVRDHIAKKFMEAYFDSVYGEKKKKTSKKKDDQKPAEEKEESKGGMFGRGYDELEDNFDVEQGVVSSLDLGAFNGQDKGINWAKDELARYIEQ